METKNNRQIWLDDSIIEKIVEINDFYHARNMVPPSVGDLSRALIHLGINKFWADNKHKKEAKNGQ